MNILIFSLADDDTRSTGMEETLQMFFMLSQARCGLLSNNSLAPSANDDGVE